LAKAPHDHGAFGSLRHREFAWLWFAGLISNTGSWMHDMAAGWLMTTLNPTPLLVALVQTASTLPVFLLALPAGTLADRMDRRRLLLGAQFVMLLLAALLGAQVLAGSQSVTGLLLVTLGIGICTAVISPTWQSIIPQLVEREDLPSAIALHALGMNISRAIGPALGGLLIASYGLAWPFLFNATSFIAVLYALWRWQSAPSTIRKATEPFWSALRAGLTHARSNRALANTLRRSVLFFVFASCYWALLPLIAREQLHGGPGLFGILVGCIGVGAVCGALLLPRLRARWGIDAVLIAGTVATAVAMLTFASTSLPAIGMVAALLIGAAWIASLSSLNVAAQIALPDTMRARGMGLYTMVFYGSLTAGSLLWGQIATALHLVGTLQLAAAGALAGLAFTKALPLQARSR
jgi:predicted MFS family arabinose efflux permease